MAVLFVVLWMPLTAHCSLENLPGLHFLQCDRSATHDSCATDSCQTVESGLYKVSDNPTVVPVPVTGFVCAVVVDAQSCHDVSRASISRSTDSPPELPQRWQFLLRTATPARAPSFLS